MKLRPTSSVCIVLLALAGTLAFAQQPQQPQQSPVSQPSNPPTHRRDGGRPSFGVRNDLPPTLSSMPPGIWWHSPHLTQVLALSADQQKRMDDIVHQNHQQIASLSADMHRQAALLQTMLDANPFDAAKAGTQITRVAQSRAAEEEAVARMLLGIRTVLSADQWTKLQVESSQWQAQHPDNRHWQGAPGSKPGGQHTFPGRPGNGAQPPQPVQPPA